MQRVPEPELMSEADQAAAYAAADFEEAHARYPRLFQERFPIAPQPATRSTSVAAPVM